MSASKDENTAKAVANQEGEIGSRIMPTGPQTTKGHQPGQITSPYDQVPESNLEVLPPGTAPASKTFTPRPDLDETPSQALNPAAEAAYIDDESAGTSASDTLIGATSADVHQGLGHPGSGQSSAELRDRTKDAGGLQGVGAVGAQSHTQFNSNKIDTTTSVAGATKKLDGETKDRDEDRRMYDDGNARRE